MIHNHSIVKKSHKNINLGDKKSEQSLKKDTKM